MAAELFAAKPYDEVLMEDVAQRAAVSRALLYRHFPSKRDLFAAVYRQAADQLLVETRIDPSSPLLPQVRAGLDRHIDYFAANRHTVLAANRVLAGDPVIQAVVLDEMAVLRERLLGTDTLGGIPAELVSAVLMSWLVFVRTLCVDWLTKETCSRGELRDICLGALTGALAPLMAPGPLTAPFPGAGQSGVQ
ncbi:TetR family transcriptional regulator [Streptomyces mashuensis]|uniref:TetR family transcriptional regulator n=1 Tax=Streptomyces mashuensis TaxID=33904 RepID=A0A919BAM0_9ACTN|nr:TetR family transcriptional regulator [Streptomyces mashuensis]